MKAVIFIPTLTAGGAERVASILANKWCRRPETSVTIVLMFDDEIFFYIDPSVKIRSLGLRPNRRGGKWLWSIAAAVRSFRKTVGEEAPDFVLSFMHKYNVFCLASLWNSSIPVVVSERGSPTEQGRPLTWVLRRLLYPRAIGIITQSADSAVFLKEETSHQNIKVINNPISGGGAPRSLPRQKIVLNVGRLVPKKGQADLLRAFAKVGRTDWSLVFCGDGPLRPQLEALATELGIEDRVRFEGTVTDVSAWYSRAGVFAFPSYFEGFPNALAEAMVAGMPVVSHDCPTGPSELIQHGTNGFLVDVGDIDRFALHLQELMTNEVQAERLARNAAKVADVVDPAVIANEYLDFCVASRELHR